MGAMLQSDLLGDSHIPGQWGERGLESEVSSMGSPPFLMGALPYLGMASDLSPSS